MITGKPISGPVAIPALEGFDEAHRALLADDSIQFELPTYQPPTPPGWLQGLARFLSEDHPMLSALLWILLALAVTAILYLLMRRVGGWQRRGGNEEESADWRPDEAPARALLAEADALAAQGRFGDAVHLLLFRSIEDIDSRRPDLVRPALTSRDIASLPDIPDSPRGAFARIAMMVERSLFGRRALAEADWRDCRTAYEEFAFAEAWRA